MTQVALYAGLRVLVENLHGAFILNPHIIGTQSLDNGLLYSICSIDVRLPSLPSHSQHVETPRQAVHRIANLSKHPHSARPALDVLAQPTKRRKLDSAI